MVAVQFGIGDLLPPTGVKDAAEHAGICSTEGLFLVIVRIIGVGFNGVVELPVTSFWYPTDEQLLILDISRSSNNNKI